MTKKTENGIICMDISFFIMDKTDMSKYFLSRCYK